MEEKTKVEEIKEGIKVEETKIEETKVEKIKVEEIKVEEDHLIQILQYKVL